MCWWILFASICFLKSYHSKFSPCISLHLYLCTNLIFCILGAVCSFALQELISVDTFLAKRYRTDILSTSGVLSVLGSCIVSHQRVTHSNREESGERWFASPPGRLPGCACGWIPGGRDTRFQIRHDRHPRYPRTLSRRQVAPAPVTPAPPGPIHTRYCCSF